MASGGGFQVENSKKINIKFIAEFLIVVILSAAVVCIAAVLTGAVSSGWHLVDDHEVFEYIYKFGNGDSIFKVTYDAMRQDYSVLGRVRFIYFPMRVLQAYLFGLDYVSYGCVRVVIAIISLIFLYYCGKELDLIPWQAFLFSMASSVGYQSATWWKLGPQNIQATAFFAAGLFLLIKFIKKGSYPAGIFSTFFFLIMACYHESFIIIYPFILIFAFLGMRENSSLKKKSWYLIVNALMFLILFGFIVFGVGINSNTIGVDVSQSPRALFDNIVASLRGDFKYFWYFGIVLFMILLTYYEELKKTWKEALFALLIVLPQIMLYAKSGFYERYLLPMCIGWSFFFVLAAFKNGFLSGFRKILYIAVLIIMIIMNYRIAIVEADYYRFRGESVTHMLDEALELQSRGYNVASTMGMSNPEADITLQYYFLVHGEKECDYWEDYQTEYDLSDVDLVIAYNRDDRHFTTDPATDLSGLHFVKCGSIDLYFSDRAFGSLSDEEIESLSVRPTIYGIGR